MTVVVAMLGLILLIVIHEMGHMLTAKALGVRVPEFGVGFGPAIFKKKFGKTVYSFRIILLGGFAKLAGMEGMTSVDVDQSDLGPDTYPAKAPWRKALIIFAGPFANLVAAVLILAGVFMFSGVITGATTEVDEVVPNSFAADVGIQSGDQVLSVDGQSTEKWQEFQTIVSDQRPGDPVTVIVERNGAEKEFSGELGSDPQNDQRALVGVQPVAIKETFGPLEALGKSVTEIVRITGLMGAFVGQLVTGEQSFYDNVSGPVGITTVGSESVQQGFFPQLLALISLNLALFNLLPLLPLDGGHLLFIAAEKVMGRPVRPETMGKVAAVGIALVLALFLFATYADVSKLFTGQPFIPE
ncbi:MAG: RIP metalloprotease RseP [Rubrobacteraceae bacterium]|nr:RIP metalloprotease RseP [Actinomycetota bacterium]